MPRMMAKRQITYAGKKILPGVEFDALTKSDAAVLSTLHYAVPVRDPDSKVEDPGAVSEEPDPEPEATGTKPKPKRRYRRRDMRAE